MLDIQVTHEVADAIESLRPSRPLTIEDCTTPELRMEYIAQWLENGTTPRNGVDAFDMRGSIATHPCGTACCILGCANVWWGNGVGNETEGAKLLGLDSNLTIDRLFYAWHIYSVRLGEITPAWAARCIRHYQKTGVVDWEGTR